MSEPKNNFKKNKRRGNDRHDREDHNVANLLIDARGAEALQALYRINRSDNRNRDDADRLPRFHSLLGDVRQYGEEGVDHINVSSQSKTELGRMFSLKNRLSYEDPVLGVRINSLQTWSLFLKSGMAEPLILIPYGVEQGRHLPDKHVANSFALQAHAIFEQIRCYPEMSQLLISLKVPLDWYITGADGRRLRTAFGAAHAAALRVIQEALLNSEAPDFTPFFDRDVQAELNNYERVERIARGMAIIQEQLAETAEALKKINRERKEQRDKQREQKRKQHVKSQGQQHPAANAEDRKGKGQRNKPKRKPVNLGSLNHLVPVLTLDDAPAAPAVQEQASAAEPQVTAAPAVASDEAQRGYFNTWAQADTPSVADQEGQAATAE